MQNDVALYAPNCVTEYGLLGLFEFLSICELTFQKGFIAERI